MLYSVSVVLPAPNIRPSLFMMRYRAGFPPVWALISVSNGAPAFLEPPFFWVTARCLNLWECVFQAFQPVLEQVLRLESLGHTSMRRQLLRFGVDSAVPRGTLALGLGCGYSHVPRGTVFVFPFTRSPHHRNGSLPCFAVPGENRVGETSTRTRVTRMLPGNKSRR